MNDTQIIKQHNAITFSKYEFTQVQLNLFFLALSKIQETDQKLIYQVHKSEFDKANGQITSYSNLKETVKKFFKTPFYIKTATGYVYTNLFASLEYFDNTAIIEIEFSSKMKKYLIGLKNNFTTYKLNFALKLSSQYSKRLYMILSSFKNTGWYHVSYEELRTMLMLNNKYSNITMFNERILNTAKKELAEKTDISFNYELKKTGKKVSAIFFEIYSKELSLSIPFLNNGLIERLTNKPLCLPEIKASELVNKVPETDLKKDLYDLQLKQANNLIKTNMTAYAIGYFSKKYSLNWIIK